jgi:gliding motility-associated-like protein
VIDTFNVGVNLGPEVCYGDSSYIELILDQPENYDITWDGKTSIDGHILKDFPGSFLVNLTEKASGCEQQYTIDIPGSSPLGADFNFIPNQDCIDIIDNKLTILNLAYGYTDGFMNFGITDDQIDINTGSLSQIYEDIGIFEITQIVFNELGCSDTLTREICVENRVRLFVPNVFTPNGDDVNDFLSIYGIGITNFSIQIYDRWGNQVFKTKDINESWDGKFNGTLVSQGVYAIAMQYENQETGKVYVEYFDVTVSR